MFMLFSVSLACSGPDGLQEILSPFDLPVGQSLMFSAVPNDYNGESSYIPLYNDEPLPFKEYCGGWGVCLRVVDTSSLEVGDEITLWAERIPQGSSEEEWTEAEDYGVTAHFTMVEATSIHTSKDAPKWVFDHTIEGEYCCAGCQTAYYQKVNTEISKGVVALVVTAESSEWPNTPSDYYQRFNKDEGSFSIQLDGDKTTCYRAQSLYLDGSLSDKTDEICGADQSGADLSGCACSSGSSGVSGWVLGLVLLGLKRRRSL